MIAAGHSSKSGGRRVVTSGRRRGRATRHARTTARIEDTRFQSKPGAVDLTKFTAHSDISHEVVTGGVLRSPGTIGARRPPADRRRRSRSPCPEPTKRLLVELRPDLTNGAPCQQAHRLARVHERQRIVVSYGASLRSNGTETPIENIALFDPTNRWPLVVKSAPNAPPALPA